MPLARKLFALPENVIKFMLNRRLLLLQKQLICLLVPGIAAFSLSALDSSVNWRWSHPVPHGNNIMDIVQKGGLYIQATERGQIYSSSDLKTWTPRQSNTTNALRGATFFGDRIVIVGENGTVVSGDSVNSLTALLLGTSDWLEGVAASPTLLVAVGDNGSIYTSPDAVGWTKVTVPFNTWLRSVAYGTPGQVGTFVAVGEEGFVATSSDGRSWAVKAPLTSNHLNKIAWADNQFVVVGEGGAGFSSLNAQNWFALSSGAANPLNTVAAHPGSLLVAGDGEVRLRERGTWLDQLTSTNLFPPPSWTYLSALRDDHGYVLGGRTGLLVEGFKTDVNGQTFWLPLDDSPRHWLWDIARVGGLLIAVGDRATVLTSLDGISWAQELPPVQLQDSIFLGVGGSESTAVAIGSAGSIMYSPSAIETIVSTNSSGVLVTNQWDSLGIYWHPVEPRPSTNDLQGITFFNSMFVVSGGAGTILTSADGVNWTKRPAPTSQFLSSMAAFPGGIVAAGKTGTLLSSSDALTWTARVSGTADWIYRVRYLGGKLVAVGQNGLILTSEDGVEWTRQISGTTRWLNDVQLFDGVYFAVGTQGTVLRSSDAVNWVQVKSITGKSLYGIAQHESRLVTVGTEGTILRTRVASVTSPVGILQYPTRASENVFVFTGEPDQRFRIDRSVDLRAWTAGHVYEIDSSGTLIVIDQQENAPSVQFYRATTTP
jgi:hypothetical protein